MMVDSDDSVGGDGGWKESRIKQVKSCIICADLKKKKHLLCKKAVCI